jgi:indolepyruvate decarboxylase
MTVTVIQHVLKRLKEIGITDVFGVPGDFTFPVNDAICEDPELRRLVHRPRHDLCRAG